MSDPNANRPGYKETKVGWIPEEWEALSVDEISISSQLGGDYAGSVDENGVPLIKMGNMGRGRIILEKVEKLRAGDVPSDRDVLRHGDFVLNTRNTLELVGKTCIWRSELVKAVFNSNILKIEFDSAKIESTEFACFTFNAHYALKQLRARAIGTTSVAAIYWRDLLSLNVIIPPLPEQKKIAEILSTWDETIEKTGELIEAKKRQKRALMQQLLTGKKRLPGFDGEWRFPKASELFEKITTRGNGSEPVLSVTQDNGVVLRSELGKKIDYDEASTGNYKLVEPNDFVISLRSFQGGLEISTLNGLISPAYHVIRGGNICAPLFYRYFFKSYEFIGHLDVAVIGIRDGKQVSYDDFSFLRIPCPPKAEQEAIGEVLSVEEEHIDSLEQKLAALQRQKRALMQKLLTGQIRVKT